MLSEPFRVMDVRNAVFNMAPFKVPVSDGYQPAFYQKLWDIVGSDLTSVVFNYLNNSILLNELNKILITLIPKV